MRRWKTTLALTLLLTATPWLAGTADAADSAEVVRGLVQKQVANGNRVAAPQIEVKLVHDQRGVAKTFTRSDGTYHLRDVAYGSYELQIEHRGKTLKFAVKVDEKVEDVRPVVLR